MTSHAPLFASLITGLSFGLFAFGVWWLLRKRRAGLATAVLVAGALLLVGAFVPWWGEVETSEVRGRLGGAATLPVVGASLASVTIDANGTASLVGARLALSCPARCNFTAPGARIEGPHEAEIDGGPLTFDASRAACRTVPFTMRLFVAPACSTCTTPFLAVETGRSGTVALSVGPTVCG